MAWKRKAISKLIISYEVKINIKYSEHTGKTTESYPESWTWMNMGDNIEGRSKTMTINYSQVKAEFQAVWMIQSIA